MSTSPVTKLLIYQINSFAHIRPFPNPSNPNLDIPSLFGYNFNKRKKVYILCKNSKEQFEILKTKLTDAYHYAKKAHELAFKDNKIALKFLIKAHSTIHLCESIYYSNYSELKDPRFKDIFVRFCIFMDEMFTNIETYHLQQQTNIEFNKLKESFNLLIDIK
ncbi:hypothetical protein QTI10_04575 [Clostridium perfringens]|nr:hypothetical protein [Clostridium perfringens]MDM0860811.1 hypothetical protein [Clostridium perfringens]